MDYKNWEEWSNQFVDEALAGKMAFDLWRLTNARLLETQDKLNIIVQSSSALNEAYSRINEMSATSVNQQKDEDNV